MKASHEDTFCFIVWTPPMFEPTHELPVLMAYVTSNLAIYSHGTSRDTFVSYQKHKIDSLLLSSRCMTNYMKSCSFLHVHFFI